MIAYVARRLASLIVVMALVGVCVFLLLHLAPGDPAAIIAGDNATPEQIAGIRTKLGLDEALPLQFLRWSGAVLSGDLGVSIFSNTPVTTLIGQRLEPTLSLALATLAFAVPVALVLGVLAAWRAGSSIDRASMIVAVTGFSAPAFVVGYLMIYVFAVTLKWFPVQGYTPIAENVADWARHLVLPALTLGL
ncbi:MAG: ABC transporter permease, partial [Hyphomicrobiales bacterium]|nr:ABC transporter permease [Hyphomicrobiales bacterium]